MVGPKGGACTTRECLDLFNPAGVERIGPRYGHAHTMRAYGPTLDAGIERAPGPTPLAKPVLGGHLQPIDGSRGLEQLGGELVPKSETEARDGSRHAYARPLA